MNDKIQALIGSLTECINCLTPGRDDAEMKRARAALKAVQELRSATQDELEEAREQYAYGSDDDLEVDDDALVSADPETKNVWVSAWVYVRKEN